MKKTIRAQLIAFSILLFATVPAVAQFSISSESANKLTNADSIQPVTAAFPFNFSQDGEQLTLDWEILPGYYLYRDKISVKPDENAVIDTPIMREGITYQDEFFGEVKIFKEQVTVTVPILEATNNANLKVTYQGCAESGFCYPPETLTVPLNEVIPDPNQSTFMDISKLDPEEVAELVFIPPNKESNATEVSSLSSNWWQPLLFLLLGIGLAFTPCVLPMYPILTGIVLGGERKSHWQTFKLAMLYIQGMALTYTLLGLVVASAGLQFQAALQHPVILVGLSILFLALAASMFGAFQLQLPASMQEKLSQLSNQQQGGNALGVFVMGAISGLICSPCTTAPYPGHCFMWHKQEIYLRGQ